MRLIGISYDYGKGPIPENEQQTIEITDDLIELAKKKDIMIRELNGKLVVFIDTKGCRFTQR